MRTMSSLRRDYISRYIRSQLYTPRSVLQNIEQHDRYDDNDYTDESLKRVEINLKRLRKFYRYN